VKTSCFFSYQGDGRVSIARFAPRKLQGFRVYSKLAPGPWFNSVSIEEYLERFHAEILAPLDPAATWNQLHKLVAPYEPVLLCWERPPVAASEIQGQDFCHRRIVAEWFEKELGMVVPEIRIDQPKNLELEL
jgi:hypothetical protein